MKRILKFIFLMVGLICFFQCQEKVNISNGIAFNGEPKIDSETLKKLDSLDIDFQLRGNCYAFSSKKNAKESNGEAHSENIPKPNNGKFEKGLFGLFLSENELQKVYEKNIGHTLYLINTTDKNFDLSGQDSRLDIKTEIKSNIGIWTEITYLPSSWCGNSYHTITLGKNEYWEFTQPIFKGSFKTKLRYKLEFEDRAIVSNEIVAFINPEQMNKDRKEGHKANNIMNPYNE
ncbi:hypothetical protein [Winogradskyella schleiferi]|uniref:hypothetical protein n=1 Tax=Winogradskyella schleiferi TaxID=2686078 RepID=UPI0015C0A2E9|nr:hypothetical protein [Winogradskyella schleiferi]